MILMMVHEAKTRIQYITYVFEETVENATYFLCDVLPSPTNGIIYTIGVTHTPLFKSDPTDVGLTEFDTLRCFLPAVSCPAATIIENENENEMMSENDPSCGCTTQPHTHCPTTPNIDRMDDTDTIAAAQREFNAIEYIFDGNINGFAFEDEISSAMCFVLFLATEWSYFFVLLFFVLF